MILKRIAAVCFAIAFLMAIVIFTGKGTNIVDRYTAKYIFLGSGAIGFFLNLLAFRYGKSSAGFNFIYWLGSIVLFFGLVFRLMHWPYGLYIIIAGLAIIGISFFYTPNLDNNENSKDDILDDSL